MLGITEKKKNKVCYVKVIYTQKNYYLTEEEFYSLKVIVWKIKSILGFCDDSTESHRDLYQSARVCISQG